MDGKKKPDPQSCKKEAVSKIKKNGNNGKGNITDLKKAKPVTL
jgi:hypothetical protein